MSTRLADLDTLHRELVVLRGGAQGEWVQHKLDACPLTETRKSCLDCVRKHLAQALVLMEEVKLGYPDHRWIAIGHLAEASAESVADYPKLAALIRRHRVRYMNDEDYVVPVMDLIEAANKLAKDR